ncbi:hypothetical protein F2P81_010984 [Scophthalmus maximus]|uniref:Uncharacterized protein n=1 Tax=Scophthalmus maximus TaxID=52904 RepID=A0A6A4T0A3_SCOMX|nr:hypothetical protein F2P81_010984 [Scophthalmus maximus]
MIVVVHRLIRCHGNKSDKKSTTKQPQSPKEQPKKADQKGDDNKKQGDSGSPSQRLLTSVRRQEVNPLSIHHCLLRIIGNRLQVQTGLLKTHLQTTIGCPTVHNLLLLVNNEDSNKPLFLTASV